MFKEGAVVLFAGTILVANAGAGTSGTPGPCGPRPLRHRGLQSRHRLRGWHLQNATTVDPRCVCPPRTVPVSRRYVTVP